MDYSIADIVRRMPAYFITREPNAPYLDALGLIPYTASELLTVGGDSIVIALDDNKVLKISESPYSNAGSESFEVPVLDRGMVTVADSPPFNLHYIVQPRTADVDISDALRARKLIESLGFTVDDFDESQFGRYNDKVVLIDSFALSR